MRAHSYPRFVSMVATAVALAALTAGCAVADDAGPTTSASSTAAPSVSASGDAEPSPSAASGPWDDSTGLTEDQVAYSQEYAGVANMWAFGPELELSSETTADLASARAVVPEGSELLGPTEAAYSPRVLDAWGLDTVEKGEAFAARFVYETYLGNETTYDTSLDVCLAYLDRTAALVVDEWRSDWVRTYDSDDQIYPCANGKVDESFALHHSRGGANPPAVPPGMPYVIAGEHALVDADINPDDDTSVIYKFEYEAYRPATFNATDGRTDVPGILTTNGEVWLALRRDGDTFLISGWYGTFWATPSPNVDDLDTWRTVGVEYEDDDDSGATLD